VDSGHGLAAIRDIPAKILQCEIRNAPYCVCLDQGFQITRKPSGYVGIAELLMEDRDEIVDKGR
jgi:hypothetical protein